MFEKFRLKKRITLIGLAIAALYGASYHVWLFSSGILTNGDWPFYFKNTMTTLRGHYFSLWLSDQSFGRLLSDVGQAPTYALYGLMTSVFNSTYSTNERLIHMLPAIILAPISSYILTKSILHDKNAALIGSIVYSFNTYFIGLQTGDITLATAYAFTPLVLWSFIATQEKFSLNRAVICALLLAVQGAYEPRSVYICLAVLFIYVASLFAWRLTHSVPNALGLIMSGSLPIVIFALINFYWIYAFTKVSGIGQGVIQNSLFGNQYLNLKEALALFGPYWSGGKYVSFVINPIPIFEWILPAAAITGLAFYRQSKKILFFGVITILGILLTKQSDFPLPNLYLWLFKHFPGFDAYREGSKFFMLIALGYSILIPSCYLYIVNKKPVRWVKIITFAILTLPLLVNTLPLITNKIGATFVDLNPPKQYLSLNHFLDQPTYFRTLWMPETSRWGLDTSNHPFVSSETVASADWNQLSSGTSDDQDLPSSDKSTQILSQNYLQSILDDASIKYVIVPERDIQSNDDFFARTDDNRQLYVQDLNNISFLKRVKTFGTIAVYENSSFKPYISTFTQLDSISNIKSLSGITNLINDSLSGNSRNFTTTKAPYTTDIEDQYSNLLNSLEADKSTIKPNNPQKGKVRQIYSSEDYANYTYNVKQGILRINSDQKTLFTIPNSAPSEQQKGVSLQSNDNYFIQFDNTYAGVNTQNSKSVSIGSPATNTKLFATSKQNVLPAVNSNTGLWSNDVQNCNPYGVDTPDISMFSTVDKLINKRVIALHANSHAACTGPGYVNVHPGKYIIKFQYRVSGGQHAGYQYSFNNSLKPTVVDFPNNDGQWHTYISSINVPSYGSSINLLLTGRPTEILGQFPIEYYSDLGLYRIQNTTTLNTKTDTIKPTKALSIPTYDELSAWRKNLFPNPKLISGPWQKKVSDCDNYDNKPSIGMSVIRQGTSKVLQLSAERHAACTGPNDISVIAGNTYLLSFDYETPNSGTVTYRINYNDQSKTTITRELVVNNSMWHSLSTQLQVPQGATKIHITFFAYSDATSSHFIVVNYKNFYLYHVPNIINRFYTVDTPKILTNMPEKTTYKSISATEKIINIKGSNRSFFLEMNEAYNKQWNLYVNNHNFNKWYSKLPFNSLTKASTDHFDLNDFENGWYINTAQLCKNSNICHQNSNGTYNLNLVAEFAPERYFNFGIIVTLITLSTCLLYILLNFSIAHSKRKKINTKRKLFLDHRKISK